MRTWRLLICAAMVLGLHAAWGCASCEPPVSQVQPDTQAEPDAEVEPDSQGSPGQFYEDQCPDCATPGDDTFDDEVD